MKGIERVATLLQRKGGEVFSVKPAASVFEAIEVMAERGVGALLVMEGERLVGVLSERDYARKVILKGRSSAETPVWQIMSSPVTSVSREDSTSTCMMLMTERKIRHLPVVEQGRVIGVLSIGDLVKEVIAEQEQTIKQLESYIHS